MTRRKIIMFILVVSVACTTNNKTPQQNSGTTEPGPSWTPKKFLFDNTRAETAGNADWIIDEDNNLAKRFPTPAQATVSSSTGENYWTGALSAWGIALVKMKQNVETLQTGSSITYGDRANSRDLSRYDVFVVDEPNIRFSNSEKIAVINFVKNGGGLFIIADHAGSDRNNDGWDSPSVWNDLMTNNPVQQDPFGFSFDLVNISGQTTNITTIVNPVTQGKTGTVTVAKFYNGTTIRLSHSMKGLIWQDGYGQNAAHVLAAYGEYGKGRVIALGDSSPADDGTGARGNDLHKDWADHSIFFLNASLWLAKLQ